MKNNSTSPQPFADVNVGRRMRELCVKQGLSIRALADRMDCGQSFILDAGDSLLFEAYPAHRWHNAGETTARSLLLLYPADERDRPNERHFTYDI